MTDNVHDINEAREARARRDEELEQIAGIDNDLDRTEAINEFAKRHPSAKVGDINSVVKKIRAAKKQKEKDAQHAKHKEQTGKPQEDGRIVVLHTVGRPDLNADMCIMAMKKRGALVFRHGDHCARVEAADTDNPSLSRIDNAEAMIEAIAPHVVYFVDDEQVDPPANIARTIIQRTRAAFDPIRNIIRAPTMRPDCSILNTPGYDPATQLFYVPTAGFILPEVPEQPTREQALAAVATLSKPIACFPFTPLDRAVGLSAMLIAACRGAFGNVPMTLLDATAAGSGKGKIAQVLAAIALGRRAAAVPPGHDKKELAKRVVAHLLTGASFVYLDNLEQNIGGADLCSVLTESPVNLRRLGVSEQGLIDAKLIVVATGNGVMAEGDMTRRAQTLCIDWQLPDPENQEFPFDPGELALQMRGELLAAAFTIIRAYVCAGKPGRLKHQGSFEQWSDLIRSALVWLGEADPAESINIARKNDPDRRQLQQLAYQWLAAFVWPAAQPVQNTQLTMYHKDDQRPGFPEGARSLHEVTTNLRFEGSRLEAIMMEIAPGRTAKSVCVKTLGRWLGARRAPFELIVGEHGKPKLYRFASRVVHDHTHVWWVEECPPKADGGETT